MEFRVSKVTALPSTLTPSTVYYIAKSGDLFDVAITNNTGTVVYRLDAVTAAQLTSALSSKFNIPTGTTAQYLRGDGTPATLNKAAVGLGNVDNTSDLGAAMSTSTKNYIDGQIVSGATPDATTTVKGKLKLAGDLMGTADLPKVRGLAAKAEKSEVIMLIEKGTVNGVATLDAGGKIPNSQIPELAISRPFPVNSQAEMLALSNAQTGDVAIRSDTSTTYILKDSPATVLANWVELKTPSAADTNLSVSGRTATTLKVDSSTGLSATVPSSTPSLAGLQSGSDKTKLDGIQAGAEVNPSTLPPSGAAGGDLTGSYPNPTVGTGKINDAKLASNAVTTIKIANGAVTDAKIAGVAWTKISGAPDFLSEMTWTVTQW